MKGKEGRRRKREELGTGEECEVEWWRGDAGADAEVLRADECEEGEGEGEEWVGGE